MPSHEHQLLKALGKQQPALPVHEGGHESCSGPCIVVSGLLGHPCSCSGFFPQEHHGGAASLPAPGRGPGGPGRVRHRHRRRAICELLCLGIMPPTNSPGCLPISSLFSGLSWVANGRLTSIFPCRFGKAAAILAAHVKAGVTAGSPPGRFVVRSVSEQCVLGHTIFIALAVYSVCLLTVRTHAFTSFQPLCKVFHAACPNVCF